MNWRWVAWWLIRLVSNYPNMLFIIIRNKVLGVGAVFKDIRAWLWEFFRAHFKKTERKKFQGKWILWKTSAGVQNCPNPMKSVKPQHNPKIASWAKIYKNANFKGSLCTLSFRPFFGPNWIILRKLLEIGNPEPVKGGLSLVELAGIFSGLQTAYL